MKKTNPSQETRGFWRLYHRAMREGDAVTAVTIARRAARMYTKAADDRLAGMWRRALSKALFHGGDLGAAHRAAYRASINQPDQYERALSLVNFAAIATLLDRHGDALGYFDVAARVSEEFPDDAYLWGHFYGARALTYKRTGRHNRAIIDSEAAIAMLEQTGEYAGAAMLANNIANLLMELGCHEEAENRLRTALKSLKKRPVPHYKAVFQDSLGYLYVLEESYDKALKLLTKSEEGFTKLGDKPQLIGTVLHLAELFERKHSWVKARRHAARAVELATEIGDAKLFAKAEEILTRLPSLTLVEELVTSY